MSTHRSRRDAVLRAAAAPAHPEELAGEDAAVAAFRAAADVEAAPARPSRFRAVLAKVLTVKAVIAVAVTGSAGVVLATTSGVLPAPWSPPPPATHAPPVPATTEDRPAAPAIPPTHEPPAHEPEKSGKNKSAEDENGGPDKPKTRESTEPDEKPGRDKEKPPKPNSPVRPTPGSGPPSHVGGPEGGTPPRKNN